MDTVSTKIALRERFAAYRASLAPSEVQERSTRICENAWPLLEGIHTVHAYWPMTGRGEVDVRPLLHRLWAEGRRVVLPRVASFDRGRPTLTHHLCPSPDVLAPNRWRVLEPPPDDEANLATVDAVLVPALGAGRNGHRIGHGWGYYDRFLADLLRARPDALRLGVIYGACLVDRVPAEAHDVALTHVVTEREALAMQAGG